jgi:hypothetical protein
MEFTKEEAADGDAILRHRKWKVMSTSLKAY